MRIQIATQVEASIDKVKAGFTQDLFLSLNPPFPPVKLLEFGGCNKGDKVSLELNFLLFKQRWVSDIIEDDEDENQWYFVDKGIKLPFFLKTWQHRHVVKNSSKSSLIIDDISYSTGTILSDILMYPLLYGQFLYRKPIYKKLFKKD